MIKRIWVKIAAWRAWRLEHWELYCRLNRDDTDHGNSERAAFEVRRLLIIEKQTRLKAIAGIE